MTQLLTAAQMVEIEQAAITSGKVTGLELMERAGRGVVEAIFEEWPELDVSESDKPLIAHVLCGPGNNGGDGFVIARLLKERGWEVDVRLLGTGNNLPHDALTNYQRLCKISDVAPIAGNTYRFEATPDLVVDALFGTGLARPVGGDVRFLLDALTQARQHLGIKVVAVDVPSGLCSDSGRILGQACPADLTVSFHSLKLGHVLADGPATCGKAKVADIGLTSTTGVPIVDPASGRLAPLDKSSSHKFSHGHALVLSGGFGKSGAARLAARAALRTGAGLVTLGVPPAAGPEVSAQITSLMMTQVADAVTLSAVLQDDRINALCVGPGFGLGGTQADLLRVLLETQRPTVLDADALTLIARDPSLFDLLHECCVLTPHGGEFARLFADIADKFNTPPTTGPAYSKVDATRAAAKRAGCTVLFKGADTVIAGQCSIHSAAYDRAAPWLATAGAGDVLAGIITGLLARGVPPMGAAETAAWLHVEAARSFGPGLIAEDLPDQLPAVLASLCET